MPLTYTNRKGKTYTLCQGTTKSGRPRYYFTPNPTSEVVDTLPEGYEIRENVNGQVSIGKKIPQQITQSELELVQRALKKAHKPDNYRVDIKGKQIILYERVGPDVEGMLDLLDQIAPLSNTRKITHKFIETRARFSAMVRFTLIDKEQHRFEAQRIVYSGSGDEWTYIGSGTLGALAAKIIPVLDTDEFYDLL